MGIDKGKKWTESIRLSSREDEGGPFEVGFQEQASNRLKRLFLREMVVSVEEKSKENSAGDDQKDECKWTIEDAL